MRDVGGTSVDSAGARAARLLGRHSADGGAIDARREQLFHGLAAEVGADMGHWAWGEGHPKSGPVLPVAIITRGLTDDQKAALIDAGLSAVLDRYLRGPALPLLQAASDGHLTWMRRDFYPSWANHPMRKVMLPIGMDEWMHAVHYVSADRWSNLWLARVPGRPPFDDDEKQVVDLVFRSARLLHAAAGEPEPSPSLEGLTRRQRVVTLMLLDGMPRKQIAHRLGIAQNTVHEHCKAIFRHFGVGSLPALAAHFLRGR